MEHTHHDDRNGEDRIRAKAYELWIAEGCPEGRADDHWLMAMAIIADEDGSAGAASPTDQEPVKPSAAA